MGIRGGLGSASTAPLKNGLICWRTSSIGTLGRRILIERGRVEREAIVVRGHYDLQPLAGARDDQTINVTADALDINGGPCGGGSGDFQRLLTWLSRLLRRRVLDETLNPPSGRLKWEQHESSVASFRKENPPELDKILALLAKQTSLEISRRAPNSGSVGRPRGRRSDEIDDVSYASSAVPMIADSVRDTISQQRVAAEPGIHAGTPQLWYRRRQLDRRIHC